MKFVGRELRAIGYVAKKYGQSLSLCQSPYAFFIRKDNGETVKIHIIEVLSMYDDGRKEDAKERQRLKTQEKRAGMLR